MIINNDNTATIPLTASSSKKDKWAAPLARDVSSYLATLQAKSVCVCALLTKSICS